MTYSDAIIKRLTDLCVERGITTNKLATLSGITQSTLNSMMRGETKNPKLKTLRKIAMGFNMTVSELLDFPEMNEIEYSCAMKSHFRKFGNQMSGSGNHLCNYASLLA